MQSKPLVQTALDALSIPHKGESFCCPNVAGHKNNDRNPSAGIIPNSPDRWHCFGCGESGDAYDVVRLVRGCSYPEARRFLDGTGMSPTATRHATRQAGRPGGKVHTLVHKGRPFTFTATPDEPRWPTMRDGTEAEIEQLSKSRGINPGCLRFAQRLGILRFADVAEGVCWLLTDATGRAAEARRLDRELWTKTGKKAWAFPGSRKDWPVGLRTDTLADSCSIVLLTEGPPDCLAALELLAIGGRPDILPCAMLGSKATLGTDAIAAINKRPVLIWADSDENNDGEDAALQWAEVLLAAGSPVEIVVPFEGGDTNDFLRTRPSRADVRARIAFGKGGK